MTFICAALLATMAGRNTSAQTVSTDVTLGEVSREDPALQTDLERLQRIERVQAELNKTLLDNQSEIAAIRKRIAERASETAPQVAYKAESTAPPPPAEMPASKSSVNNSKVALLPERASVEEERWRFYVGGELLYVQPRWSTNPAYASRTVTLNPFQDSASQKNFDHDFNASPVITAGIVGPNGLGLRGRYWGMDSDADTHAATTSQPNTFPAGETITSAFPLGLGLIGSSLQNADNAFTFRNSLRVQTGDAELTWTHTLGPATFLFSGGARYANIRQGYDVDDALVFQGQTFVSTLHSFHRFEGFGPTISADLTYALGWCGLSIYANARGSVIFGEDREQAVLFSQHRELSQAVALSIAELEGGLGWSHSFNRFGVELRAGVVGQMWLNAGNGANNENIIGTANSFFGGTHDQTVDPGANLGLIGFQFSSGIHF